MQVLQEAVDVLIDVSLEMKIFTQILPLLITVSCLQLFQGLGKGLDFKAGVREFIGSEIKQHIRR